MEVLEMLDDETIDQAPAFPLWRLPCLLFLAFLCSPLLVEAQPRPDSAAGDTPPKDEEQVAAIPEWSPADPEIAQTYRAGRAALDEHDYSEAKKQFRKLRTKARGTDGEETLARCLMEAEGGLLCEKAGKYVEKEQPRKIIALWLKESEDVEGTFTGLVFKRFYEEAMAEVFLTLADFEPKKKEDEDSGEDEEEDERRRGDPRGRTSYGQNTRLIEGSPEEGEVRQGRGSLYWLTTSNMGVVTIEIPNEVRLEEYRYLRLTLRAEESKAKPPLTLIFDCEAGPLAGGQDPEGGGRRGRRGDRSRMNLNRRVGFHSSLNASARWQDLRLDLRKFDPRSKPRWGNVLNLRIVHTGAGGESAIFIDEVFLEKE